MKLVLLSGGSGKRLWPLSNDTRSKQFLQVLEGKNGEKQSMVQRVWGQLENVGLAKEALIATSKLQREMIQMQLGLDVRHIVEPERRDTFPAIALAAAYLYSVDHVSLDEVITVLPVDPFVEDDFFESLKELDSIFDKTDADIALIGVQPTYPSEKYGYIVPKENDDSESIYIVKHFVEKPSEEEAKQLIEHHALWNCGVFAFKLKYIIQLLQSRHIPTQFDELYEQYSTLPKISFDYEIVEKAKNIVVLPYDGAWKDLGTWNTLTEEMTVNTLGKGILDESCTHTHLVNELDIPVTVIGMEDAVVAVSPDGILVSNKASSSKIKEIVRGFNQPVMYEERIWGWSRTLEVAKYENEKEMVTKHICIHEGKNSSYHYHNLRSESWSIVRGEGEIVVDGQTRTVKAGDIVYLKIGQKHGIRAITELELIEVQIGYELSDDDFVRLCYQWEDICSKFDERGPSLIING